MPLAPGSRIGPYEIVSSLGAGGMGEVYRARDTRLNRDVAIKVLPELFATDDERLARFEREAQTLASLNHPHIAHVYGVEDVPTAGGTHSRALVMELVEGEELAERIARGPIPVDESIPLARQIADALEAAHERGIIHRDLKPANVKVRADGTVKVLDFGLAKALDPAAAGRAQSAMTNAGLTTPATMPGIILGTAAYMAPEQARGKEVDKRADIWAFGCVLFEMLAGKRPFDGDDVTETLASIVKGEPEWTVLPPAMPASLRRLIALCLVKDPKQRLRDIGDARIVLDRLIAGSADDSAASASVTSVRRFGVAHLVIAAAAVGLVAALATWRVARPVEGPRPPLARFVTPLGYDALPLRIAGSGVAFSPDGTSIVYAGQPVLLSAPVLYRRKLLTLDVERLPNTEGAYAPFFSPDGRWIGFFTDKAVMKMSIDGGSVSKVCDRGSFSRASWGSNDTIVLGTSVAFGAGALGRVSAAGGISEPFTTLTGKETHHQLPHALPDRRHVVFTALSPGRSDIAIAPIEGGAHRLLGLEGSGPMFVPPDHLLVARGASLFVAPFDLRRLQVTGTPVQVLEDAAVYGGGQRVWIPMLGVDAGGSIAYLNKGGTTSTLGWMTPGSAVKEIAIPPAEYGWARVSPDGRRAAAAIGVAPPDIWVMDLERGTRLRLTSSGGSNPIWSPDGSRIAYNTQEEGILSIAADGSGAPEPILPRQQRMTVFPTSWFPDRKSIVATAEDRGAGRGTRNRDIWIVRAGEKPVPLLASPADERGGAISPDGRWLAYASSASGREEVYVRALAGGGATIPVSSDGGTLPMWSPSGDAVYFLAAGPRLMRASFKSNPPDVGPAALAASLPPTMGGVDVASDGRFLIVNQKQEAAARDALHVLLNWGPSLR